MSLCMRLVLVKSPREFPELIHTHTHTPTFQQGGKVIGFADARVASEKVVGSLTQLFKVLYIFFFFFCYSSTPHNFGIFNFGEFLSSCISTFSFGCVSQNRPSLLLVVRLFVFVWVSFGLFFESVFEALAVNRTARTRGM